MALEVVHADERLLVHPRERLGHGAANQERAHQSRPLGHGDAVETGQRHASVAEGLGNDRGDDLEVPARGQLGNHAAVGRVNGVLRGHDARNNTAAVGEDRGRPLVT